MSQSVSIAARIAQELAVRDAQVVATITLLDEGATVPFIARYRKEVTGGLDDTQLRRLEERLGYLRELEERRAAILKSIDEQGKLTDGLKAQIVAADTKAGLEDLYLPYRPKRRTKAQIAKEQGLEPLADALLSDPSLSPESQAAQYVDGEKGVADIKAALDGARQILMERMAEDARLIGDLREHLWDSAYLVSSMIDGQAEKGAKFSDYFDYREKIKSIPSHRALALFRGRNENVLTLKLLPQEEVEIPEGQVFRGPGAAELKIARAFNIADRGRAADAWLVETVRWAWRVKIHLHLELELTARLKDAAEDEAIEVFARNLRALMLQAPAGMRSTLGLDPGIRTGVKVAVVDPTGKVVETTTVYPFPPKQDVMGSLMTLASLCRRHKVELIAIGNGTASRETERLAVELMKRNPELKMEKLVVSEAGASVYSASELAALEFPDLDVSLRGAVSIGRRLQDPLAELVKIDPKAIGVGQYQHDVNQTRLGRSLDAVVEDCVNSVGVEVNTASAPLLARVAGLSAAVAGNIVAHRDRFGPFRTREQLKQVERLGPKAFEQAAGFLRIRGGDNPLDASGVHPEAYPVVERIIKVCGRSVDQVMGDSRFLSSLKPSQFTDDTFGEPTVRDILKELDKPGRDPRPEFKTATFADGVERPEDLKPGMVLEGVVTNVTNFGAFVDVGVHQDGLVHISVLANRFVKDPHEVVKPGDVVKVKVMEVDLKRQRIALSMRLDDAPGASRSGGGNDRGPAVNPKQMAKVNQAAKSTGGGMGALADAFARAKKKG